MKKVLSILMILLLMAGLMAGCGDSSGSADSNQETSQNEQMDNAAKDADTEGMGDLLSAAYVDMMKNDEYFMKYKATMDMGGEMMEVEATIAVSGDNYAMQSSSEDYEAAMVIKGDKIYNIDHESKTVSSYTQAQENEAEAFDADELTYVGNGKEDGFVYEEYSTADGSVKYYFDGKDLVKIASTSEEQTTVMEILEMSNKVPASMFEIPADYQLIEM